MFISQHMRPLEQDLLNKTGLTLYNFPVSLFSAVMGTAGLSRAFRLAESLFHMNRLWSMACGIVAWLLFFAISLFYTLKFINFPYQVLAEFSDPVSGCFFATIPIGILLLSAVTLPYFWLAGVCCWIIGAILIFILSYQTVYRLLTRNNREIDFEPALILPAVGILNVTQTGGFLHTAWGAEINKFCFAVGTVLTVVFFNLIFSRLLNFRKLSEQMEPSLMILMSPFGVCFLAYGVIAPKIDLFATVLFYFALFLFVILIFRVLIYQTRFRYTWWSLAFPVAALTNSALRYALNDREQLSLLVAGTLLAFLFLLNVFLFFRSMYALTQGKLLTD